MSDQGNFDGMLTDEPQEGEAYVVPNYIETKLSKERLAFLKNLAKESGNPFNLWLTSLMLRFRKI